MSRSTDTEIVFSESFADINAERFNGWIIHLICLSGSGSFRYNDRVAYIGSNEVAVIAHPELVSEEDYINEAETFYKTYLGLDVTKAQLGIE